MFTPSETPILILADGTLGTPTAKMATGIITYGEWPIVAVIDKNSAGKTVEEVTGIARGKNIPVVATLEEGLTLTADGKPPKALVLGTAPRGGQMPPHWIPTLKDAITSGLHVISGLHDFLSHNMELVQLALKNKVLLWDVRDPDSIKKTNWWPVALQKPRPAGTRVITMVGSDCSVGKMFSALELHKGAGKRGKLTSFAATGQVGIMIAGRGVPLDRVIGDFMAGYLESLIFETIESENPEWVFVEGQGSLYHPGYSGVTMSLLHGSNPDGLILCHNPALEKIRGGYEVVIPPLPEIVETYTRAAHWIDVEGGPRASVLGISLNTSAFSEEEALKIIKKAENDTGLPATDPVRFGVSNLLTSIEKAFTS